MLGRDHTAASFDRTLCDGWHATPQGATFSTTTKGIDASYSDIAFYSGHVDADRDRVNGKFDLAERQGWAVADAVTTAELATTLDTSSGGGNATCKIDGGDTVAIVLVNQNVMVGKSDAVYVGHYVVAVGFVRCHDIPPIMIAFAPQTNSACMHHCYGRIVISTNRLILFVLTGAS
jgi:hypothetical protein